MKNINIIAQQIVSRTLTDLPAIKTDFSTINLEKAIEILSDVKNNSDSLGIQNINVTEKIKNEPTSSYFDNENKEKPEQLK